MYYITLSHSGQKIRMNLIINRGLDRDGQTGRVNGELTFLECLLLSSVTFISPGITSSMLAETQATNPKSDLLSCGREAPPQILNDRNRYIHGKKTAAQPHVSRCQALPNTIYRNCNHYHLSSGCSTTPRMHCYRHATDLSQFLLLFCFIDKYCLALPLTQNTTAEG